MKPKYDSSPTQLREHIACLAAMSAKQTECLLVQAAAEHRCTYLVNIHASEFLSTGGDYTWLQYGLKAVPSRLRRLAELNRILAHQPWLVTKEHIEVST